MSDSAAYALNMMIESFQVSHPFVSSGSQRGGWFCMARMPCRLCDELDSGNTGRSGAPWRCYECSV